MSVLRRWRRAFWRRCGGGWRGGRARGSVSGGCYYVRYGEGPPVLRAVLRYRHGWERVLRGGILLVIMVDRCGLSLKQLF